MVCYYNGKRIGANYYTEGKFGKRIRETLDTGNRYLYACGRYHTKLTKEDLPPDYIPIHSRAIWYMNGYLRTTGIRDMRYSWVKENHLFKDDYIYVSYSVKIKETVNRYGFREYTDYDIRICGNDIVKIVLASEKYSGYDTSLVRLEIEKKRVWLRDNEPEEYAHAVGEDKDIFDVWKKWIDKS